MKIGDRIKLRPDYVRNFGYGRIGAHAEFFNRDHHVIIGQELSSWIIACPFDVTHDGRWRLHRQYFFPIDANGNEIRWNFTVGKKIKLTPNHLSTMQHTYAHSRSLRRFFRAGHIIKAVDEQGCVIVSCPKRLQYSMLWKLFPDEIVLASKAKDMGCECEWLHCRKRPLIVSIG